MTDAQGGDMVLSKSQVKQTYATGMDLLREGKLGAARQTFASVSQAFPQVAEAWYQIGVIDNRLGNPFHAAQMFERALKLKPDEPAVMKALEEVSRRVNRPDVGAALNRKLIKQAPQDPEPLANLGLCLLQSGEREEAVKVFKRANKKWPAACDIYRMWFTAHDFKSKGDPLLRRAEALWKTNLSDMQRLSLGYALGKAYEDLGLYDKAFKAFDRANEIGRARNPFDPLARRAEIQRLLDGAATPQIARRGGSEAEPIFIIGLPRSGTTLVERIIAAHSRVAAGGELGRAYPLHRLMFGRADGVEPLADIDQPALDAYADQLMMTAQDVSRSTGPHITDKSIQNAYIVGYLAAAFPKARFVLVRRDHRDVALSIYKNRFANDTHLYAYSLGHIASVQRTFERAIAHWQTRVPFIEVSYDDLTMDASGETRRLIAELGLEWEDNCLSFYKQKSVVATLSLTQVRQPIHGASRGGWRHYEHHLGPYLTAYEQDT